MCGDRIGLGEDGHGARGSVNASLCFGLRHALHSMSARFELELRIRALADDAGDDFLESAHVAGTSEIISIFHLFRSA